MDVDKLRTYIARWDIENNFANLNDLRDAMLKRDSFAYVRDESEYSDFETVRYNVACQEAGIARCDLDFQEHIQDMLHNDPDFAPVLLSGINDRLMVIPVRGHPSMVIFPRLLHERFEIYRLFCERMRGLIEEHFDEDGSRKPVYKVLSFH